MRKTQRRHRKRHNRTRRAGKIWNPLTSKYGFGYGKTKRQGYEAYNEKYADLSNRDELVKKYKMDLYRPQHANPFKKAEVSKPWERKRDLIDVDEMPMITGGRRTRRRRRH